MVKPCGLWSRPSAPFGRRRAAELAAPEHQRVVEQAARFQIGQQAGDRLVDLGGVLRVPLLQVAVLVPLDLAVAVRDLHEPHAALDEPPGQQALPAEVLGHRVVEAVQLVRRRRFRRPDPGPPAWPSACGRRARTSSIALPAPGRGRPSRRCSRFISASRSSCRRCNVEIDSRIADVLHIGLARRACSRCRAACPGNRPGGTPRPSCSRRRGRASGRW